MTHKIREKPVPPEELAAIVVAEVNASAIGLRGRKLREYKKWAYQWWKEALMGDEAASRAEGGKEKDDN